MKRSRLSLISVLILTLVFTACANYGRTYTMVASKDFSVEKMTEYQVVEVDKAVSYGEVWVGVNIPWPKPVVEKSRNINEALKDIHGAVALLDVRHTLRVFSIPILFTSHYEKINSNKVLIDPSLIKPESEVNLNKE